MGHYNLDSSSDKVLDFESCAVIKLETKIVKFYGNYIYMYYMYTKVIYVGRNVFKKD